jgi:hypothetical protein
MRPYKMHGECRFCRHRKSEHGGKTEKEVQEAQKILAARGWLKVQYLRSACSHPDCLCRKYEA